MPVEIQFIRQVGGLAEQQFYTKSVTDALLLDSIVRRDISRNVIDLLLMRSTAGIEGSQHVVAQDGLLLLDDSNKEWSITTQDVPFLGDSGKASGAPLVRDQFDGLLISDTSTVDKERAGVSITDVALILEGLPRTQHSLTFFDSFLFTDTVSTQVI